MRLLYRAYACENRDDAGKILLPGYLVPTTARRLQPGETLHIELVDGTRLQTRVLKTQNVAFDESTAERLRTKPGFHCAVIVPDDFDPPGIALGADVYVDE